MPTTIKLKNSVTTTNAPSSLVQGEVAINITDKKVWVGNAATTPIQLLGAGASMSFGALTCTSLTDSGLTSGRVTYATTGGLLTDSAGLTFDGTNFATTGTATATRFIPSGSTVATNGMYLPAANAIGISTNSTNAIYIDSSQNVGIGTSSPNGPLDVNAATPRVVMSISGTAKGQMNIAGSAMNITANDATFPITFNTGGGERMRIDSSGNVGIGTSSPTDTNGWSRCLDIRGTSTTNFGGTYFGNSDATVRGYVGAGGASGSGYAFLGTATNHYVALFTNNSERMRITSAGELVVGTTTADGLARFYRTTSGDVVVAQNTNNGNHANFVSRRAGTSGYAVYFDCAGNQAGTITHPTTTSTNYGSGSDYRLKDNIQPLNNALNIVGQLKPSKWTWKTDGSEDSGFIAHELQELFPSAVTGQKDEVDENGKPVYQCVDTSFLVATLTAAIKEQQAMIEELKAEVALLKSK